jgi:hypothetical protein
MKDKNPGLKVSMCKKSNNYKNVNSKSEQLSEEEQYPDAFLD